MNLVNLFARIDALLDGIDRQEDELRGGWWRTPDGALIGRIKLRELKELLATEPVAVSERPWEREGWCDAKGRCWVGHLGFREKVEETGEFFTMPDEWQLEEPELDPVFPCVLLPHWAIPLPTTTQGVQS
jgi:hypothetical protein